MQSESKQLKAKLKWIKTRAFAILLTLVFVLAAVSRFYRLSIPSTYYFDEVYHAITSKLIARNDIRAFEWWNPPVEKDTAVDWLHPPLAKYTQALSMRLWGENSFGWRFSSAVFGIFVIAITALLAQTYFHKKSLTLLATFLAALDGLLLSQSRIAMNDIHVTFFIIAASTAYGVYRNRLAKKLPGYWWLLISGVLSGVAMGSKWSGIYILVAIWIAEGLRLLLTRHQTRKARFIHILRMAVFLGIVPVMIYVGSYAQMFIQGKSLVCLSNQVETNHCYCSQDSSIWVKALSTISPSHKAQFEALEARGGCKQLISHFNELQNQIWWYQTNLKATHPFQSVPWQWVLDLRPVWQFVDYSQSSLGYIANIYDVGNPLLFWSGLIAIIGLTVLFLLRKLKSVNWQVGFLLLTYFIVWAPWSFSPRIMFFYHYAPAVPTLAVLLAYSLTSLWKRFKLLHLSIVLLVLAITICYITLYPINTGLPMPTSYFDAIFSVFPSWK